MYVRAHACARARQRAYIYKQHRASVYTLYTVDREEKRTREQDFAIDISGDDDDDDTVLLVFAEASFPVRRDASGLRGPCRTTGGVRVVSLEDMAADFDD